MIIRGGARGDGLALATYLTTAAEKKNDQVTILQVRNGTTDDLHKALFDMDVSAELTRRGQKGIYQSTINPAYGEDRKMTREDWFLAADILEEELEFSGQSRAIVLHEKKGRIHAHVVWQREKDGKLIPTSHNFKKHDAAREKIEKALQHKRTLQPKDTKQALTAIWTNSIDGTDFITKAEAMGYKIARGDRRAYVVETPDGQKLDLVRQLSKVKTHEVKERLKTIEDKLPREGELAGREKVANPQNEQARREVEIAQKEQPANDNLSVAKTAQMLAVARLFAAGRRQILNKPEKSQEAVRQERRNVFTNARHEKTTDSRKPAETAKPRAADLFMQTSQDINKLETEQERAQRERLEKFKAFAPSDSQKTLGSAFAENRGDAFRKETDQERQQRERLEKLEKLKEIEPPEKTKNKGLEFG